MDLTQMLDTLGALPAQERQPFWLAAAAVALAIALVLVVEHRYFARSRRAGRWLAVRLASLLVVPAGLAVLILPALAIRGMEALAVFYLCLFTVAPLVWFGGHLLAARLAGLARPEGLALAASSMLLVAIPITVLLGVQPALQEAARGIQQRGLPTGGGVALAHAVQPPRRFDMPGAGVVFTQSLVAPPGLRLRKVEERRAGVWPTDEAAGANPRLCADGADLHMMWHSSEEKPYVRLHWLDEAGRAHRSEFTPDAQALAAAPAQPFTVSFRPDGVDPAAPVPRTRADLALIPPSGGPPYIFGLGSPGPDEKRGDGCLVAGRPPFWGGPGQPQTLSIMFHRPMAQPPLRAVIEKPKPS